MACLKKCSNYNRDTTLFKSLFVLSKICLYPLNSLFKASKYQIFLSILCLLTLLISGIFLSSYLHMYSIKKLPLSYDESVIIYHLIVKQLFIIIMHCKSCLSIGVIIFLIKKLFQAYEYLHATNFSKSFYITYQNVRIISFLCFNIFCGYNAFNYYLTNFYHIMNPYCITTLIVLIVTNQSYENIYVYLNIEIYFSIVNFYELYINLLAEQLHKLEVVLKIKVGYILVHLSEISCDFNDCFGLQLMFMTSYFLIYLWVYGFFIYIVSKDSLIHINRFNVFLINFILHFFSLLLIIILSEDANVKVRK